MNNWYYPVNKTVRQDFDDKIKKHLEQERIHFVVREVLEDYPYYQCGLWFDEMSNGNFIFRAIECGEFYNDSTNIAPVIALSHELGHFYDLKTYHKLDMSYYYHKLGVLNVEFRAWLYAYRILKDMDFKLWDYFFRMSKECLATYFRDTHPCGFVSKRNKKFNFDGDSISFNDAVECLHELSYDVSQLPFNNVVQEEEENHERQLF